MCNFRKDTQFRKGSVEGLLKPRIKVTLQPQWKKKKLKNKTGDNQDDVSTGELLARNKQTNKTTNTLKEHKNSDN